MVFQFSGFCLWGGHFSKCIFAESSFNQKPLALEEIRGTIWRYFVMKLPSKNVENHENLIFDNSVRPDPAAPDPTKLRTVFPHTSVLPKPPQLPYGAKYLFWAVFSVFQFFHCWTPVGARPLLCKQLKAMERLLKLSIAYGCWDHLGSLGASCVSLACPGDLRSLRQGSLGLLWKPFVYY